MLLHILTAQVPALTLISMNERHVFTTPLLFLTVVPVFAHS